MSERSDVADDLLVREYLKGELRSFDLLYERYQQRIYGYVYRSVGERFVDEVFQDIWIKVLAGIERYADKGRFRSWLFSCAHNTIVDHYRKWGEDRFDTLDELPEDSQRHTDDATKQRIDDALWQLPGDQRQAFYLREVLNCPVKEIAEVQGCSVEAAKSRLRYAYKKLQTLLQDLAPVSTESESL